ncbi:hypothetical protein PAXRUDRAFT_19110 [Paxillus rubicundulus Ve08.2h10]|uniref:Uncharacterized protein n=1 Tax=Paxillus rubicundulus Ve08.2h10 TaxID=930991 RepID=A0A0D0BV55_9AGAM|nr:hypothetical protein PAXRUDRAFT_19110 [Paxillus rubicundulus Ve08.2h10]
MALVDYLHTHSKEIEDRMGDSELDDVTADGLMMMLMSHRSVPLCVGSMEKGPSNSLVAAGEHEDICAFIHFDACL